MFSRFKPMLPLVDLKAMHARLHGGTGVYKARALDEILQPVLLAHLMICSTSSTHASALCCRPTALYFTQLRASVPAMQSRTAMCLACCREPTVLPCPRLCIAGDTECSAWWVLSETLLDAAQPPVPPILCCFSPISAMLPVPSIMLPVPSAVYDPCCSTSKISFLCRMHNFTQSND